MTSNGRWPQNMKSRIAQQPLVGSYLNLKLKLLGSNKSVKRYQMKTTSNWRQPPTEEDLKISQQQLVRSYSNLKLELLGSNESVQRHLMKTASYGRRPPPEDDLKIWKVEYISNHWADLSQIWNLSYWDQTKMSKGNKWKRPQMEDDLQRKMT